MIIQFIIKYWRKVFDLLLVAGIAIAAYYFITKFMFGTKTKLQTTANMVSSIKNIGELVTAEYYGEVIASLHEAELDLLDIDSTNQYAYDWFISLKLGIDEILENNNKNSVRRDKLNSLREGIIKDNLSIKYYKDFLEYLFQELSISNYKKDNDSHNIEKIIGRLKRDIKKNRKKLSDEAYNYYLFKGAFRTLAFSDWLKDGCKKKLGRKELSIIGRGWVKAGFDFGELNKDNFIYDKERKTIHLIGFNAKILDKDINPWFIPENGVPGFQIVASKGKVDFDDAKKVKRRCVQKLEIKAIKSGIIESASKYGKETLKTFFTLLTGDNIEEVIFHANKFDQLYSVVAKDNMVSFDEVSLLQKEIDKRVNEIKTIKENSGKQEFINKQEYLLSSFIKKLKMLNYGNAGLNCKFGYYAAACNHMFKSNTIITAENSTLEQNNKNWQNDSTVLNNMRFEFYRVRGGDTIFVCPDTLKSSPLKYWFSDSIGFINEYNQFAAAFNNRINRVLTRKSCNKKEYVANAVLHKKIMEFTGVDNQAKVLYYSIDTVVDNTTYNFFPLAQYAVSFNNDTLKKAIGSSKNSIYKFVNANCVNNQKPCNAKIDIEKSAFQWYLDKRIEYCNRSKTEVAKEWVRNKLSVHKKRLKELNKRFMTK